LATDAGIKVMWANRRLLELIKTDHPILLAPMAGVMDAELAIAVANAGGLAALPAGMLNEEQLRAQVAQFRVATGDKPINLNFLAHKTPTPNNAREHAWREKLKPYYAEFGVDPASPVATAARMPFGAAMCAVVEELKPEVVSFHYGLPEAKLRRPAFWKRTVAMQLSRKGLKPAAIAACSCPTISLPR
jgi:nitronate monooxygenase